MIKEQDVELTETISPVSVWFTKVGLLFSVKFERGMFREAKNATDKL